MFTHSTLAVGWACYLVPSGVVEVHDWSIGKTECFESVMREHSLTSGGRERMEEEKEALGHDTGNCLSSFVYNRILIRNFDWPIAEAVHSFICIISISGNCCFISASIEHQLQIFVRWNKNI